MSVFWYGSLRLPASIIGVLAAGVKWRRYCPSAVAARPAAPGCAQAVAPMLHPCCTHVASCYFTLVHPCCVLMHAIARGRALGGTRRAGVGLGWVGRLQWGGERRPACLARAARLLARARARGPAWARASGRGCCRLLHLVGWCCRRAGVGLGWRCSGDWGRGMMGGAAGLNPGAGGLRPGEGGGDSRCTRTPAHAHSRLPRRAAPGGRGPRDAPSPWVKCGGRRHAARSRQRLESKRRDFEAARFRDPPRCEVLQRRDAGPLRVAPRVVPHDVSAGGRVLRSESQDARVRGTPSLLRRADAGSESALLHAPP